MDLEATSHAYPAQLGTSRKGVPLNRARHAHQVINFIRFVRRFSVTLVVHAGYFQPEQGQFGCISCDLGLGDAFQELSGQSSCHACAAHTRRYIGVLGAANQSACRCKEGSSTLYAVSFRGGFRVLIALVCRILQLGRHSWGGALVACTSSHRH